MSLAFINGDIFTGDTVETDKAVVVADGSIEAVCDPDEIPTASDVVDLDGKTLCPGFVDLQVNGGGGALLNDAATPEAIRTTLAAHAALGTTAMFPTVFTVELDRMKQLLDSVVTIRDSGVAGVHFEGPFINPDKAGVHDKNKIRKQDEGIVDLYKTAARILPTLVTLAPEMVPSGLIRELREAGVIVFAGHTNATYEQMNDAAQEGLQGGTHIFNAMSAFGSREPGTTGSLLAEDDLACSIIVDGLHVHWASVKAAWRCKPPGKIFLVTDAMPAVGFSGHGFRIGDLDVMIVDGKCQTKEGVLAGSSLDLGTAVRNCIQKVGIPRAEAIRMATLYPAILAGVDNTMGSISVGARADLIVCSNEMHIDAVYRGGEILH